MLVSPQVSSHAVGRLLRPRSIAVIGVSDKPGSMGGRALANLQNAGFNGDIHLVSRSNDSVNGRPCVASVDDLPEGIDAAIIAQPAHVVQATVEACGRRKMGGVVVFAAGFSEVGDEGGAAQEQLAETALKADLAMLGPNTLGMFNYVDQLSLLFGPTRKMTPEQEAVEEKLRDFRNRPAVAVLAQSGAMAGNISMSARARGYALTYFIATGNEAVSSIEDFLAHIVDDDHTDVIAIFAEQIRRPQEFLRLARRARENGKPVVLLHPGRSERAKASAASHTGALSGNYEVMRAMVASEAVIVVETLDEFLDTVEFMARFPQGQATGPSVLSDSGALRGLSLDFADSLDLNLPEPGPETMARLQDRLPGFAEASNPLDITAQGLKDMPLYGDCAAIMADDEASGGVLFALMPASPEIGKIKAEACLPSLTATPKPKIFVLLGDAPVDPDVPKLMRENNIPFFRSAERALRTFARSVWYARQKQQGRLNRKAAGKADKPIEGQGALIEYRGKELLREAGLATPEGGLAKTPDEAVGLAERTGYPVVLKVQSAQLTHKTEIGGVVIGLSDEAELRSAWADMAARVATRRPDAIVDGYLVEGMAPKGLEMVVGGRRDPDWGPVVLFGLGGVWIEAMKDVQLLPADAPESVVLAHIDMLKGRSLLEGARGAEPVDKAAIAAVVSKVGQLLLSHPEIVEIDVNPLVAYGSGEEPVALDALVVVQ